MPNKTFKISPGHGLTIEILKKDDKESATASKQPNKSSGLIASKRPEEPLARRTGGVIINIYDLALIRPDTDSDFAPIDWYKVPTLNLDPVLGSLQSIDNMTLDDWNELIDKIFEVDLEDWKDHYRKLEFDDAWKYGLDLSIIDEDTPEYIQGTNYFAISKNGQRKTMMAITGGPNPDVENSKWTSGGLKLPKSIQNLEVICTAFANRVTPLDWLFISGFSDDRTVKITEERDFEAEEVTSFNLSGPVDLFLVPLPALAKAFADDGDFQHHLIGRYEVIDRQRFFVYDDDLSGEIGGPAFSVLPDDWPKAVSVERISELEDFYKLKTGSVYYRIEGVGANPEDYTFGGGVAYNPSTSVAHELQLNANDLDEISPTGGVNNPPGLLLAVIKNKDKIYYVWNKNEDPTSRDSGGSVPMKFTFTP